jgi:hypothetical protein
MSKVEINVQPVIEKLKAKLQGLGVGQIRALKGVGKNEGNFLIVVTLDVNRDLKIKINVKQMFENKKYFDGMIGDIYRLVEKSNMERFNKCRIMG